MDESLGVSGRMKELHERAQLETHKENHAEALKLAAEIEALPYEPRKEIVLGGVWIDSGSGLGDEQILNKGIDLLGEHRKEYEGDVKGKEDKLVFFYFLGNGYSERANIKRQSNPQYGYFQQEASDFHLAAECYRKATQCGLGDFVTTQTLVNLGNAMDHQGRCLEALDYYERALAILPDFGMALGNKGLGLKYYARISGKRRELVLSEAHHFLDLALQSKTTPPYARGDFLKAKEETEKALGDKLIPPPFSKKYKNPGKSQVEKDYLDFGLKHGLYLNVCNFCSQRCNKAIEDNFTLETMVVPIDTELDNDPFLRMQDWLNQIRVAYATARYLLFQAIESPYDLSFVFRHVLIMETLDDSIYDIEIELLKTAFRSFYSILDQIAGIVDEYLGLGIGIRNVYFSNVWFDTVCEDEGGKKIRKTIVRPQFLDKEAWTLNALYDLNFDLSHSEYYKQLRHMRNRLIHGFVSVGDYQKKPTPESLDKRELETRTIELAKLVRNAIGYLIFFLWNDTRRDARERKAAGQLLAPMTLERREWKDENETPDTEPDC